LSKERRRNERALQPSKYNNYVSNENHIDALRAYPGIIEQP